MADETDETGSAQDSGEKGARENMRSRKTWVRLIYMLVMAVAWNLGVIVFVAVAILQFLLKLFTSDTNPNLRRFGRQLGDFFAQTARFETFETETVPFPFSPWPSGEEEVDIVSAKANRPAKAKASSTRKRPARLSTRSKPLVDKPNSEKSTDKPTTEKNEGSPPDDGGPGGSNADTD